MSETTTTSLRGLFLIYEDYLVWKLTVSKQRTDNDAVTVNMNVKKETQVDFRVV